MNHITGSVQRSKEAGIIAGKLGETAGTKFLAYIGLRVMRGDTLVIYAPPEQDYLEYYSGVITNRRATLLIPAVLNGLTGAISVTTTREDKGGYETTISSHT